jgi:hypothetical protein
MLIRRIESSSDAGFAPMLKIYAEAIHSAEQKSIASLTAMVGRPEYRFQICEELGQVVGLTVSVCLSHPDALLLEYIAVADGQRGRGIGRFLFLNTLQMNDVADRVVLIEVDSDDVSGSDNSQITKRRRFYRELGCREIEGLNYAMPRVSDEEPPPMNMFVYATALPTHLKRDRVQGWINSFYVEVYGRQANEPQVLAMFRKLPADLRLI